MELERFLLLARRWWIGLLLAALNGALLAYLVVGSAPIQYEARTRLLVGPLSGNVEILRASSSLAITYRDLATSTTVLGAAIERLALPEGVSALRGSIRSVADTETRLIDITVRYTDPQTAANIANVVASELQRLQAAGGIVSPEGTMTIVDPAEAPVGSLGPSPLIPVLFGGAAAAIAAGLLIVAFEYKRDRIRSIDDVTYIAGAKALGRVGALRQRRNEASPPLVRLVPADQSAATYRTLAARSVLADAWEPVRTVLVVGADAASGAGEVAVNLAYVYAGLGRRAFLLDANSLDREIGVVGAGDSQLRLDTLLLSRTNGQSSSGGVQIEPGLWAGSMPDADSVGISRDAASKMLARLGEASDVVVVTAGPLLLSASSLAWAAAASHSIIVARRDQTKRADLRRALESAEQVNASILGVLLIEGTVGRTRQATSDTEVAKPSRRGRRWRRAST